MSKPLKPAFISWPDFMAQIVWHQGEHVSLIGPTGSGKSTIGVQLLPLRTYVCALGTKPKDATMDALLKSGYKKLREWPPPALTNRVVVWPALRDTSELAAQAEVMRETLEACFRQGGWTVFADELWYLCKMLGLSKQLELIWSQGRSVDVTLVGGTQRPAWVPLMAYDQATHLFFWRDNDETNLRRIAGLGGLDSKLIRETVAGLARHEVLYANTRTGQLLRTKAERVS